MPAILGRADPFPSTPQLPMTGMTRLSRRLPALLAAASIAACGDAATPPPEPAALVVLSSPAAAGSAEPSLATGPDGVYLSWQEPADSGHALRFARLQGDQWSPVGTAAQGRGWFVNWADFPSMLVTDGGTLVTHYLARDAGAKRGYHYGVRLVRSTDGGRSWSEPLTPHRDGVPAEHGFVSLFPVDGDSVGVLWLDGRRSHPRFGGVHEMTVRYTTLAPDGSLGAERLVDGRVCDCCQTDVAVAASGPVAVFRDRTEEEVRDIHVARMVDGRWTESRPVHRDGWRVEACPVNGPAIDAAGERVAVAWFTAAGDTARVSVAFSSDAGATFSPPTRVDGGDPVGRVDVRLLGDGRALVAWVENVGAAGSEVRARVVTPGGEIAAPIRIAATSGERASGFPRMAPDEGGMVFAWTEPGKPSHVRVARLNLEDGE